MKRIRMRERWRRVRAGVVWLLQRPGALWCGARRLVARPLKAERIRDGVLVTVPERNGGGLHLVPLRSGPWSFDVVECPPAEVSGGGCEASSLQCATGEEGVEGGALGDQVVADLPSWRQDSGVRLDVRTFLVGRLSRGAVLSLVIKEEAARMGHSWATVRRAKKDLGIEAVKEGVGGAWVWRLPKAGPRGVGCTTASRAFEVWLMPEGLRIGSWDRAREARRAVRAIEVALTVSEFWKWARRLAVLGLVWLLVTSYLDVRGLAVPGFEGGLSQSPSGTVEPSPLAQTIPLPLGSEPFVATPGSAAPSGADAGDIAARIRFEAEQARLASEKSSTALNLSAAHEGLEAFGLKSGGPGCDPRLAFKVPR